MLLADILMRCLEKDPLQRPHSASVIIKTIDALHAAPAVRNSPPSVPIVAPVAHEPQAWRTAFLAVAVLVLVAAAWWVGRSN